MSQTRFVMAAFLFSLVVSPMLVAQTTAPALDAEAQSRVNAIAAILHADRGDQLAVHKMVTELRANDSQQSRELLFSVASNAIPWIRNPNLNGWAARNLLELDKSYARPLFNKAIDDRIEQVIDPSLHAMVGMPVDEQLVRQLGPRLISDAPGARWRAAEFLTAAPQNALGKQVIELMAGAVDRALKMPNGADRYPRSLSTNTQMDLQTFQWMLVRMQTDNAVFREVAAARGGDVEDFFSIVLAFRGDVGAHDALVRIVSQRKEFPLHVAAVRAIGMIGNASDLPLLQALAQNDPTTRPRVSGDRIYVAEFTYPVREAARASSDEILRKIR